MDRLRSEIQNRCLERRLGVRRLVGAFLARGARNSRSKACRAAAARAV